MMEIESCLLAWIPGLKNLLGRWDKVQNKLKKEAQQE
jgi:hypothetical protein